MLPPTTAKPSSTVPELLTDADVKALLGCSVDTIRALCAAGKLKSVKAGRSRRFRPEWVMEYMDAEAERRSRIAAGAMIPTRRSAQRHGIKVP